MTATATLTALVTAAMKPLALAGGFKRDRLNYRRRRGATSQLVQFQLSRGNSAAEARTYVNVAVALDALSALAGEPVPERPAPHECPFHVRLEQLVADAPPHWTVDAATDTASLSAALTDCLARATAWLDTIDGPAALLRLPLAVGSEQFLRAQLLYVTGDRAAARVAVERGVAYFADRGMTLDAQLRELHLEALA